MKALSDYPLADSIRAAVGSERQCGIGCPGRAPAVIRLRVVVVDDLDQQPGALGIREQGAKCCAVVTHFVVGEFRVELEVRV